MWATEQSRTREASDIVKMFVNRSSFGSVYANIVSSEGRELLW